MTEVVGLDGRIIRESPFGKVELTCVPMPDFARDVFATYLANGRVMVYFKRDGDPAGDAVRHIAVLNDDGSDFREIFTGEIKRVPTSNGFRHMPFADNKRVHMGDYILECEPNLDDCQSVQVVPVKYPWGIAGRADMWMHWSEIIVAPDNEHMCWTTLTRTGGCTVTVAKLQRETDKYTLTNLQVISNAEPFMPDPEREGCVIPLPMRGGEVKQFVYGGLGVSQVGSRPGGALPDSVVQCLSEDKSIPITLIPGYEETTIFSPDEKLGLTMSTRGSPRTNLAILGLLPRPHAGMGLAGLYQTVYLYAVAGPRFFRKGNVGPVLIDVEQSTHTPGYPGLLLADPAEEWVYHSPMSWRTDGKRVMWQEQRRDNGARRIRIAILHDYQPGATVRAQPTPDDIPYAISEPPSTKPAIRMGVRKIAGKHSGYLKINTDMDASGLRSRSEYHAFSEDGLTFYNGFEQFAQGAQAKYEAVIEKTGDNPGAMKLRLTFSAGGYEKPPRLLFDLDAEGKPMSYGFAEYGGMRLDAADYSE